MSNGFKLSELRNLMHRNPFLITFNIVMNIGLLNAGSLKDFPIVEHCLYAILEVNKDNMSYIISYMILCKLSLKRMVLYTCALHVFFF